MFKALGTQVLIVMGSLSVWFDEEGDFLEVVSEGRKGFFRDLGNGVFERVDEEGNTIGFALLNVKERKERDIPFDAKFEKAVS
ncbi:MAG: hypothetical protein MAG715_00181 [Methanonatronarchaeales archaeon]|nr:hypothetical protein [Methanonatronarchaeales archaeon]